MGCEKTSLIGGARVALLDRRRLSGHSQADACYFMSLLPHRVSVVHKALRFAHKEAGTSGARKRCKCFDRSGAEGETQA